MQQLQYILHTVHIAYSTYYIQYILRTVHITYSTYCVQYILHTVHIAYSTYYVQCILTRYLLGITMLFVCVYYMGLCVYSVVYSSYILHRNMYTTCTSCSMFHCAVLGVVDL